MAARHMSLSLGAREIGYLQPGSWEVSVSYRYLHSENIYVGSEHHPEVQALGLEPRITANSVDFSVRYGLAERWSVAMTMPFIHSYASVLHPVGERGEIGRGLKTADIRGAVSYWVLDPKSHFDGNLSLSLGLKTPSANEGTTGTWMTPAGPEVRPVDIALQPGDGGWGIILGGTWYQRAWKDTTAYASGFYMFNPKNTNGVIPPQSSDPAEPFYMSIPDQYLLRGGLNVPVWTDKGLSASAGLRVDGIPVHDAFGASEGFRRPGYTLYFEPGVTFTRGNNVLNVWVPVALTRSIETSVLDAARGVATGGGLADFLVLVGYTRRF
jgi:hypothetical protein